MTTAKTTRATTGSKLAASVRRAKTNPSEENAAGEPSETTVTAKTPPTTRRRTTRKAPTKIPGKTPGKTPAKPPVEKTLSAVEEGVETITPMRSSRVWPD
ncbi:hypothetical protein [Thiomicrorhabdus sp.]|uniref:hypothetical protein n=1 Tax=Thiomicrorhabdus sp. TaxID=2039724 RepID=UPI0029C77221|nr:hypothetical protein [Thiomicrorhabdus sp.]